MNTNTYRPSPTALLNPCADPIFKILFTDESEEAHLALTGFLTDIIGKEVSDVVLQPNELSGESVTDKQSEFDINCKVEGKMVNVEMQGLNQDNHFGKRAEYHAAKLYNHYVAKGMKWIDAPQVYQISVLNFVFDEDEPESLSHYFMKNASGRPVARMLNIIFLELPKVAALPDDISLLTPAQMWGKFFLYAPSEEKKDFVQRLAENNRGIKMAVTVLKNISQDEINWYHETRYWMRISDEKTMIFCAEERGHEAGLKQGLEQGILEGSQQKAIEAALKMIKMKYPVDDISEITGLSPEKILELKG